jgi:hypothetical protein
LVDQQGILKFSQGDNGWQESKERLNNFFQHKMNKGPYVADDKLELLRLYCDLAHLRIDKRKKQIDNLNRNRIFMNHETPWQSLKDTLNSNSEIYEGNEKLELLIQTCQKLSERISKMEKIFGM